MKYENLKKEIQSILKMDKNTDCRKGGPCFYVSTSKENATICGILLPIFL